MGNLCVRNVMKTYSIVTYARLLNKNTADFTAKDTTNFLEWLAKGKKKIGIVRQKHVTNIARKDGKVIITWR